MDVARDLLDHQLADRHGDPCGRIDDVVLRLGDGTGELGDLLSGGAVVLDQMGAAGRLLRPLLRFAGARRRSSIGWPLVRRFERETVHVAVPREELGLARTRP